MSFEVNFEVIQEYPPDYCNFLELAYGPGMMSEGGAEGIEQMFDGVSLSGTRALDMGSGLGGVATYLANAHEMRVTGLDINPWMIEEAARRIPPHLTDRLTFACSTSNEQLDFPDSHFDIVYSKGALCHVEEKRSLFQELFRVMRPGGRLVINDAISPVVGQWGENIDRLVELEGLTLFAHTEEQSVTLLQEVGFEAISVRDDSPAYCRYNREIVERHPSFRSQLSEEAYRDSVEGYTAIANALEVGELRVLRFLATK